MKILVIGVGGFIGSNLVETVLREHRDWKITGVDISFKKVEEFQNDGNLKLIKADVLKEFDIIDKLIQENDVILPFAAVANPSIYVTDPLRVFNLDFESNLAVVKKCVQYKKRVIFPSTSEVYGMCSDTDGFDEFTSNCVTGPICKQRWIYSCSKQMLDRVIYAYGERDGLQYTLFRPFNWVGPKLDDITNENSGTSRVLTQFLSNIVHGKDINLVDGGKQSRSFTYISDGISALIKIIENKNGSANSQIFNIGNPDNLVTIATLAEIVLNVCRKHPKFVDRVNKIKVNSISSREYFGQSYQDISCRIPSIENAKKVLNWKPEISLEEAVKRTVGFYFD